MKRSSQSLWPISRARMRSYDARCGCVSGMRPAYGSGEDWNPFYGHALKLGHEMRLAYGPGEDWNNKFREPAQLDITLRPAYNGSGED